MILKVIFGWALTQALVKYNRYLMPIKQKVFDALNNRSTPSSSPVFAIEEDHLGAIWAGYFGNGLVKLTIIVITVIMIIFL